jgi:NADP-dependent 3-hydroxy acid dehydrogenase YdfG
MADRLQGTVALVTGASSGIGRAAAGRLAAEGAAVAVVARRRGHLDSLVASLATESLVVEADLADADQSEVIVAAVLERFDRLDILVNAAGQMLNGPSIESPLSEWQRMVDVNLAGLLYLTKAALPHLLSAAQTGHRQVSDVVNISSIAGRQANALVAAYNATKFGVTAFSESLRQEFTQRHVRTSVIEPGFVATELFGHQQEATQRRYDEMFAGVEALHPDDVADAIAYIVTRSRRVAVNEIVIRPTDQR